MAREPDPSLDPDCRPASVHEAARRRRGDVADRGARSTARPNQARWGAHVHCRGEFLRLFQPFRDRLSQLGWAEPRNIRIDYRWANNNPDLGDTYARELVGFAPDAMFAAPGPAVEMLQRLTRTIPVVFVTSTDPVRAGYVASY